MSKPELANLAWRKSSLSGNGPDCVEVAFSAEAAYVRNSRQSDGHVLSFLPHEWNAFIAGVRNEEFEFPAAEGDATVAEPTAAAQSVADDDS